MQKFNDYLTQQADILAQKAENLANRSKRQYIYRVTVLTIYGFQVAVPVLIGIFGGQFLDKCLKQTHFSWTLNLILLGFIVGFYNANRWFCHTIGLKKRKKARKK